MKKLTTNSHISNDARLVEANQRLKVWGAWHNYILNEGLNASSKSVVGQLIDNKGCLIKATNPGLVPTNEEAEEIDELINQYAQVSKIKAKILVLQYALQASKKEKCQRAQLSPKTFYKYLNEGVEWIGLQIS